MHKGFDRWLARPSTLSFLRQLIGEPCPAVTRSGLFTRPQCRTSTSGFISLMPRKAGEQSRGEEQKWKSESISSNSKEQANGRTTNSTVRHDLLEIHVDVNDDRALDRLLDDKLGEQEGGARVWVAILEQQQRLNGVDGIRAVWLSMRRRQFDIPVVGRSAEWLWSSFVHSAAATCWLSEVLSYAQDLKTRKNVQYPRLHSCIVGYFLVLAPLSAVTWHDRLCKADLVPHDAMKQILAQVIQPSETSSAEERFRAFRTMYHKSGERDLYDLAVGMVLTDIGHEATALKWHRLFISHGDSPSTGSFASSDIRRLFELDENRSLSRTTFNCVGRVPTDSVEQMAAYPQTTRGNMSKMVREVHGTQENVMSDNFVAKLFATGAVSIEAILSGISFFGIDKIGPLALRELAIRTGTPAELCDAIRTLEKDGIRLGDSVFCRLMRKTANESDNELFQALLRSDQHYEAYEDALLQGRLLDSQLAVDDWSKIPLTLAVLDFIGQDAKSRAWNQVLQHFIKREEVSKIIQTMQQIQSSNTPLTIDTCIALSKYMLPQGRRGRRPREAVKQCSGITFIPHEFVMQAFMYAHDHGLELNGPWAWPYLITSQGGRGWFDGVERSIIKLANTRSRTHGTHRSTLEAEEKDWIGAYLSDPELHGQIVVWGFRQRRINRLGHLCSQATLRELPFDRTEPWARGLVLIWTLDKEYGVPISTAAVRHAFLSRMIILFGPGRSEKRLNNEMRRRNRHSLGYFVRHINSLWPDMFPQIPDHLLQGDAPENHPHLLRALFGQRWRVNDKRKQYLDVEAWTKHLLVSRQYIAKPVSLTQPIPFTYHDDTNLKPDTLHWRAEHEQVLHLRVRPGPYGRWARSRRVWMGEARSMKEKRALDERSRSAKEAVIAP